jgi:hemerythrin-like domain-containing protein
MNMIEKIDHNQVQDIIEQGAARLNNSAKTDQKDQSDASLQADYASLISKALSPENDSLAVQNAKKLLQDGQLDNPENIKQAAENIITFGI